MKVFTVDGTGGILDYIHTVKHTLSDGNIIDIVDNNGMSHVVVHKDIDRNDVNCVERVQLGKTRSGRWKLYDEKNKGEIDFCLVLFWDDRPEFDANGETRWLAGNLLLLRAHEPFTLNGDTYVFKGGFLRCPE
jgi:hypothetical protein